MNLKPQFVEYGFERLLHLETAMVRTNRHNSLGRSLRCSLVSLEFDDVDAPSLSQIASRRRHDSPLRHTKLPLGRNIPFCNERAQEPIVYTIPNRACPK